MVGTRRLGRKSPGCVRAGNDHRHGDPGLFKVEARAASCLFTISASRSSVAFRAIARSKPGKAVGYFSMTTPSNDGREISQWIRVF